MKFSRQKLQHLKWLRRKELIRINCFIMIAILLMVLLFMGFPIVSNAESAFTYEDTLPAHLGITDTDILVPRNITQEEGYCYLMADDNKLVYFDDDLTNGAIIWDSSIDSYEYEVNHGDFSSTYTVADAQSYRAYFTSNNSFVIEFYMTYLSRYVTFQENSNNNSKTSMCYIGPYGYDGSSWDFPVHNYKITVSFTRNTSDNNFYVGSTNGVRGAQAFTSNQRYYDGEFCYYGVYGQVYILGNIDAVALPIEPYLKRASYHVDPNDNTSNWVTDWVNASGISYNPNYTPDGPTPNPPLVLDNNYIGTNNFMYGNGSSINNFDLKIGVDFNEDQMRNISDYSYQLDCNLKATYTLGKHLGSNAETQLLSSYGYSFGSSDTFIVNNDFYFTINDNFSSNYFSIPSSVFNDGLVNSGGYTAVPLVNYISSYVPASSITNQVESFFDSISQATIGPFSLPGYTETNYFTNCNIKYDFVMNIYNKDGDQINSLPLALSYDPMTGQQDLYSDGGGVPHDQVQNIVDTHNENKQPTDPDYLPPSNYNPTLTPSTNNNDNSSNSSSYGGAVSVVNNPSITIQQGNKFPEKGVMQSFVRIINNDKNNTVNDIDTLIGGSSYIQLMNNALVAVPDQVWSIWITALKAILGIAVSAFFLKILINWAT